MKSIYVTPASNVQRDSEGNILFEEFEENEDDENSETPIPAPLLIDDTNLGILRQTHCIQAMQLNPETQLLETGVIFRSEVVWENRRIPAVSMEDPQTLCWISFEEDEADAEESGEDDGQHAGYENEDISIQENPLDF